MEACLKFARRYWYTKGDRQRTGFVALTRAFHGRTFGSLSVTADPHYREPFEPLVPGVTFVDPADPGALDAAVTDQTAAIVVEPIQGEGGVRPLPAAFVAAIRAAADRTGTLVIADEVQSGLGRTGHAFHSTALGLDPDLISIGKALGGGIPIGAALLRESVSRAVAPGDHGSTYGGNLLACRAGLYFVDQLLDGGLLAHVAAVGAQFEHRLQAIAASHPMVSEVRGAGVIRGLEIDRPASDDRRRGAAARAADQRDGQDGRPAVAAVDDHDRRDRRSDGPSRPGVCRWSKEAGSDRTCGVDDGISGATGGRGRRPASGDGRGRAGDSRAHREVPGGRTAASTPGRGDREARGSLSRDYRWSRLRDLRSLRRGQALRR